jgi:predicted SnoaL-like aldol condensation-catalyzing enzyme
MRSNKVQALVSAVALLAVSAVAAAAESINPPTMPQTAPMNAQEKKNLQLVLDWTREVLEAHHVELAPKYMAESYIQHNPNIDTGRDAFVKYFGARRILNPIPDKLLNPPVVMGAKGDFVWMIMEAEQKDPRDPENKTYHYNTFAIVRIQNGLIQEHWSNSRRTAKSPVVQYGVSPKPPSQWNTGKLSGEEKKTLALATEELKDMLQYGHLELADKAMDPGYIQHNPNVPQGREGFKAFMSRVPGRVPQPIHEEWKNPPVLTLVNGPYAVMMWDRKEKDPADPTKEYTYNHYDAVRVENGMVKEHWDEAVINPPAPPGRNP